jgi:hypothetical protein
VCDSNLGMKAFRKMKNKDLAGYKMILSRSESKINFITKNHNETVFLMQLLISATCKVVPVLF